MHAILGAGGVIGREASLALGEEGVPVRQVSRNPKPVNAEDEVFAADLLDARAVDAAVEGSEVAYLVVGLRYDAKVWEAEWPRIMDNVMEACIRHGVSLAFFDNVYAYGRVEGVMTEDTPFNPCSQKGEVRAQIATTLLEAMARGEIRALILRAADFYGPGATLSFVHHAVFERLRAGKKPQWIGDPKKVHTFTYARDAARTLPHLAKHEEAWGHTWHAPTRDRLGFGSAPEAEITGEAFVRLACEAAGRPYRVQTAPRRLLRAMGLFNPILRENDEMMYQFEHDYRFGSRLTQDKFRLQPMPYEEGIRMAF